MTTFQKHNIIPGTLIEYVHPNTGNRTTDTVIRIEGNYAIVSKPRLDGTLRDFPVNASFIISYTNYIDPVNC